MLEFPHPYNLLCARLFPGLVCYTGLPSRVGFPVVARQGSFVRANGAGSSPFLFYSPPPPRFFFGCSFQLSGVGATSFCHGISMRQISSSEFGCLKRAEMLGKKLCWFPPTFPSWFLIACHSCLGCSRVNVTCDPVSGNLDWRKKGFAHHSWGDSSWGKWNPNNTWIY